LIPDKFRTNNINPSFSYFFRSAHLLEEKMNCKICKRETEGKLCTACRGYLKWRYPNEDPEVVLEKYKELSDAHFYLKRGRRK